MAKGKIFSRDEADKAGKASELSQKIFSGFCEKCLIRPDADGQRHALSGQCIHLFINGLQKRHMNIGRKHFHRMRIKGENTRLRALFFRKALHFGKDHLMSQMASVKEADAKDEGLVFG